MNVLSLTRSWISNIKIYLVCFLKFKTRQSLFFWLAFDVFEFFLKLFFHDIHVFYKDL